MNLTFAIIEDRQTFVNLREEWNDLARRSTVDHAFMRHEWFTSWLNHMPFDGEIRILTARRGERLVGAAPLCLRRLRRRGIGFNALCFLQSAISPRCHFLIDRDEAPDPVFAGIDTIKGWDLAELKGLATDVDLTDRLLTFLKRRGPCVVEKGAASPYQPLPETWELFEKSRSHGFRKRFRNSANRCEKSPGFAILRIESFAELDRHFDELLEVSRKSWKAAAGTDLVTQHPMADFFREFSQSTDGQGLWVVYLLRLEDRPAAFDYYLKHADRLVGLRWEFDDSLRYFMPGIVAHVQAIKDQISASARGEYDLSGTETDFKSGLVDSTRNHVDVSFGTDSVRSRLLMGAKQGLIRWRHGFGKSRPEVAAAPAT